MGKKLCAVVLALCMTLSLCSAAWAVTTESIEYYDPVTGGSITKTAVKVESSATDVTWGSDTTSTYYVVSDTVTINGNVKLTGDVYLILDTSASLTVAGGIYKNGYDAEPPAHLTIYGGAAADENSGTLTVANGYTAGEGFGINVDSLTVNGGTVNVTGGSVDDSYSYGVHVKKLTVHGGSLTATGGQTEYSSYGIYVIDGDPTEQTFIVTGGTVTGIGGDNVGWSYGIYVYHGVASITGGTVTATGRKANGAAEESGESIGFSAEYLAVSGNTTQLTAESSESSGSSFALVVGMTVDKTTSFTVSGGGTVTASVKGASGYDARGICAHASVTLDGGTITATVDEATKNYSRGLYAQSVTVNSGTLTATGGSVTGSEGDSSESCGIYIVARYDDAGEKTGGDMTVTGGSVTATGGSASSEVDVANSYGVYAEASIDVTGGSVTAAGGAARTTDGDGFVAFSVGLRAENSLTVSDGTLTVTGDTHDISVYGSGDAMTISGGRVRRGSGSMSRAVGDTAVGVYAGGKVTVLGGTMVMRDSDLGGGVAVGGSVQLADLLAEGYAYYSWYDEEHKDSIPRNVVDRNLRGPVYVRPCENHSYGSDGKCLYCGGEKPGDDTPSDTRHPKRINTTTPDTTESAKTFDPGVSLYGLSALLSYTGTALMVRGRKRR